MIRTVQIPTRGNRAPVIPAGLGGCRPGGDCCDDCRAHKTPVTGGPIGSPETHVHAIPSMRNAQLRGALGDVQCDQDGNCYDSNTGQLLSAPLTTGTGCQPGVQVCWQSVLPWAAVGLAAVFLLGRKGR